MKPEMITLKVGAATIKVPASVVAQSVLAGVLTQLHPMPAAAPVIGAQTLPLVGEYWPGQGGHNGGLVQARDGVPAHYLIFAAKDIGDHAWGGRGVEVKGLSKTDGYTNTQILCNDDDNKHPAANSCAEYQADGRHDFYLPAAAELYHGWLNTPDLFAKDCWYWSSTQRSASFAFGMDFDGGYQGISGKNHELRVRPVRRLFI